MSRAETRPKPGPTELDGLTAPLAAPSAGSPFATATAHQLEPLARTSGSDLTHVSAFTTAGALSGATGVPVELHDALLREGLPESRRELPRTPPADLSDVVFRAVERIFIFHATGRGPGSMYDHDPRRARRVASTPARAAPGPMGALPSWMRRRPVGVGRERDPRSFALARPLGLPVRQERRGGRGAALVSLAWGRGLVEILSWRLRRWRGRCLVGWKMTATILLGKISPTLIV